jgi:phage-related protein
MEFTNGNGVKTNLDDRLNYFLLDVDGLGAPISTVQAQKAPFQDGVTYIDTVVEERLITAEVALYAPSGETITDVRKDFLSLLNPKLGPGSLHYAGKSIPVYIFNGPKFPTGNKRSTSLMHQIALITFLAPDPYWKSSANISTIAHQFTAANDGDVTTPIELVIEASGADVVNPKITNSDTGEYIELNYTVADGESVYINTAFGKKEITLESDDTNLFQYLTSGSTLFWLETGTNTFSRSASSGTVAGEMRWYNRYLGV